MYDLSKVVASSSPHIKTDDDTRSIMLDVLIAMLPALAVSIMTFGLRALVITVISVASCSIFEWLYCKLTKQKSSVRDLSAMVTGMLLAFNLPVSVPIWLPIFGGLFAIVIVKMLFGGIGCNFMNPALAARAFMMASWTGFMTRFTVPQASLPLFGNVSIDGVSGATPLASMKPIIVNGVRTASLPSASLSELFFGQIGGMIGETSAVAILLGLAYLLYRKVIRINTPAAYLLTVAVLTFLFPMAGTGDFHSRVIWMMSQLLSGGLLLGAVFMATDYTTSPVTSKGQVVFGIGCGLLTVFIRYFGGYPEGVSYSILIMNTLAWAIDKKTQPRKFGYPLKSMMKKEAGESNG